MSGRISVEQMVRNLLTVSIQEGLVRPGVIKEPQDMTLGDLTIPASLLNGYFGKPTPRSAQEEVPPVKKFIPTTKAEFIRKLDTNSIWVEKTLVALYKRQTETEKFHGTTTVSNGRGFNATDAPFMTAFAKQVGRGVRLRRDQLELCRQRNATGRHRLGKYYRQIMEIIKEAQLERQAS